jgi:hypothetical protein
MVGASDDPPTAEVGYTVLNLLSAIPHGVLQNHFEIARLVNTSQSLLMLKTAITALVFARSNETAVDPCDCGTVWSRRSRSWEWDVTALAGSSQKSGTQRNWGSLQSALWSISDGRRIDAWREPGQIQAHGSSYLEVLSFGPTTSNAHTVEKWSSTSLSRQSWPFWQSEQTIGLSKSGTEGEITALNFFWAILVQLRIMNDCWLLSKRRQKNENMKNGRMTG